MYVGYENNSAYSVLPRKRTVNDSGLGELGFNPLKAIRRAVTFKKTSFRPKNIFGAVGSVATNVLTFGAASTFAPKMFSAHSKTMQKVGMGVTAAAGVVGGIVAAPIVGSALAGMGTSLMGAASIVGKSAIDILGGTFGKFVSSRSIQEQQMIANSITPEQIAAIDKGELDPNVYMNALQRNLPTVSGVAKHVGGEYSVVHSTGVPRNVLMGVGLAGAVLVSLYILKKGD